jgi:predicted dehydrogenase
MDKTIRIAVLGTGHMAQSFAIAMESVEGVALAGFCSRDLERARPFSTYFGAPTAYAALADILADDSVDALYIANDSAAHASAAIAALEGGKAVLCEKPCGVNSTEVCAIAQAAQRTGLLFMEAISTPFLPAVARVIEAAQGGKLGELRRLTASFGYPATPKSHPGCYAGMGGGVLLDRAIYPLTLALMLMGPAKAIEAHITRNSDGIDTEAWITLVHDGGATTALGASLRGELDNRLALSGTLGAAFVEAPLLTAERYGIGGYGAVERPAPTRGGFGARLKRNTRLRRGLAVARSARMPFAPYGDSHYCAEIEHFRDLVRIGATESPVLPPSLSVAAMALIDAARTSTA